jgi:hypothetical protein
VTLVASRGEGLMPRYDFKEGKSRKFCEGDEESRYVAVGA